MDNNQIVWKSEPEIKKARDGYYTFVKAFNEAIDSIENAFSIKLRQGDVEQFFYHWKDPKPFRKALANYLWNYGSTRIGMCADTLEDDIKASMSNFTRSTLSIYHIDRAFVEICDRRIRLKEKELDEYLVGHYSVSLNSDTRRDVWQLAQQACEILNKLEHLAVDGTKPSLWFKIHATGVSSNGGRSIICFENGLYRPLAEELEGIV